MRLRVSVTPSPGTHFTAHVYGESSMCGSPDVSSTNHSGTEVASVWWGEDPLDILPNGVDDSQLITIEVRSTSLTCSPSAPYTLKIEGNK